MSLGRKKSPFRQLFLSAMLKYQLIGKKGRFFSKKKVHEYPLVHLHSLPLEILLEIFCLVDDYQTLRSVALCCKKFNHIVNKHLLYNLIVFKNPKKFYQFATIHLLADISNKINFLNTIEFINPQIKDSENTKLNIAGSYAVESKVRAMDQLNYTEFILSLSNLFTHAFGLQCVIFSEISPSFGFPMESKSGSSNIFKRKAPKTKNRRLGKLVMKTQSGWSIPLRNTHLSLIAEYFDVIDELCLVNFIIDNPITIKDLRINKIHFESCIYPFKKGPKRENLIFTNVSELELSKIANSTELSLIDLIKVKNEALHYLTLDIGSNVFYTNQEFKFGKYNPFFQLLCSGVGGYSRLDTLKLTNFELFDYLRHDDVHKDVDSWIEPPTDNFETFMEYTSQIPHLVIVLRKFPPRVKTCLKCGFKEQQLDKNIESLTYDEWKIFLKPLELNPGNTLQIFRHDYRLLYTKSKY